MFIVFFLSSVFAFLLGPLCLSFSLCWRPIYISHSFSFHSLVLITHSAVYFVIDFILCVLNLPMNLSNGIPPPCVHNARVPYSWNFSCCGQEMNIWRESQQSERWSEISRWLQNNKCPGPFLFRSASKAQQQQHTRLCISLVLLAKRIEIFFKMHFDRVAMWVSVLPFMCVYVNVVFPVQHTLPLPNKSNETLACYWWPFPEISGSRTADNAFVDNHLCLVARII